MLDNCFVCFKAGSGSFEKEKKGGWEGPRRRKRSVPLTSKLADCVIAANSPLFLKELNSWCWVHWAGAWVYLSYCKKCHELGINIHFSVVEAGSPRSRPWQFGCLGDLLWSPASCCVLTAGKGQVSSWGLFCKSTRPTHQGCPLMTQSPPQGPSLLMPSPWRFDNGEGCSHSQSTAVGTIGRWYNWPLILRGDTSKEGQWVVDKSCQGRSPGFSRIPYRKWSNLPEREEIAKSSKSKWD